jgi:hypothetical protein
VQLFFALLSSIPLKFDQDTLSDATNLDILLSIIAVIPLVVGVILETPLRRLPRYLRALSNCLGPRHGLMRFEIVRCGPEPQHIRPDLQPYPQHAILRRRSSLNQITQPPAPLRRHSSQKEIHPALRLRRGSSQNDIAAIEVMANRVSKAATGLDFLISRRMQCTKERDTRAHPRPLTRL